MTAFAKQREGVYLPRGVESYRDEARRATVTMSYRVWRDAVADGTAFRVTPSFATALRWLREGPHSSMQVLFRWRLADKEGDGHVSYVAEWNPTATDRFIEGTIRNLITFAIAESLTEGRFLNV